MKKKHLLLTMLILLFQVAVFAQGRMVKGTVKDAKTNETLPGVSVVVEGTTSGTTTDAKGEFSINVDGTGLERVTHDGTFDAFAMFSPNGKQLIFASNRNNGLCWLIVARNCCQDFS